MSGWRECKFGDIAEVVMGQSPSGDTCNSIGSGIPLLNGPTEFTQKYPTPVQYTLDAKKLSKNDDILFCVRGSTTGKMNWSNGEYAIGRGLAAIRHKTEKKAQYFIKAILDYNLPLLLGGATGSTFPNVSGGELKNLTVLVPQIPEQIAIAELLNSLDDKIEILYKQNKTLEQLCETLFRHWYVDEPDNTKQSDVLGNLFDVGIGRTPPRKEHNWFSKNPADMKWVSIKDMGIDGIYLDSVSEYLTQAAVERFNIPIIPENTVLLSFKMTIGRLAITNECMLSNEAIAHFKQKRNSNLFPEFLYLYLKTYRWEQLGSTSSIAEAINSQMIKNLKLIIPNEKSLKTFKYQIIPYFEKVKFNQKQIFTLIQLRDALLPKLMNGEITVATSN